MRTFLVNMDGTSGYDIMRTFLVNMDGTSSSSLTHAPVDHM
jgi:hypothetical protein